MWSKLRCAQVEHVEVAEWTSLVMEGSQRRIFCSFNMKLPIIWDLRLIPALFSNLSKLKLIVPEHLCPLGDLDLCTTLYNKGPRKGLFHPLLTHLSSNIRHLYSCCLITICTYLFDWRVWYSRLSSQHLQWMIIWHHQKCHSTPCCHEPYNTFKVHLSHTFNQGGLTLSTMLLTMLHRKVPHDGVKRPLYPLLFCVKVSNYTAKMLLIEAKTQPVCSRKLTPFCLKILRKRDYS